MKNNTHHVQKSLINRVAIMFILLFLTISISSVCGQTIWTGNANDNDWNTSANWQTNAIPGINSDVTIPSGLGLNYPSIFIAGVQCNNLIIDAGAFVTIDINGSLGVAGIVTNNGNITTNGNLTLMSSAVKTALVSSLGTGTISGDVTVQRYITGANGYHYFSLPVAGTPASHLADHAASLVLWNQKYENDGISSLWYYNESNISQTPHPDGPWINGWESPAGAASILTYQKGYALDVNAGTIVDVYGTLNNGNMPINITKTTSANPTDDGWNFIGNPYPSPVNWDVVDKTNIDNTVIYYDATTAGNHYGYYTTGNPPINFGTNVIAAMQGFFVRAKNTGATVLNFTNAVRINNNTTPPFYKKDETTGTPMLYLRSYSKDKEQTFDETVIIIDKNANASLDNEFDCRKMFNTDPAYPNIYSTVKNNCNLAINTIPEFSGNKVICLGFKVANTGQYNIKANNFINFPDDMEIILEDRACSNLQDLREKPVYTFYMNVTTANNRFYLHLFNKTTGIDNSGSQSKFSSWASGRTIYINNASGEGFLTVYDIQGNEVLKSQKISEGLNKFDLNSSAGSYILKFVGRDLVANRKVYIGQ